MRLEQKPTKIRVKKRAVFPEKIVRFFILLEREKAGEKRLERAFLLSFHESTIELEY